MGQPTWVLRTELASSTRVVPGLKHRAPCPFPEIIHRKQQNNQMNVHDTNLQVISDWQMPSRSVCIFIFQLIDCKLDSSWNSTPTIRGVSSRFDTLRIEIYLIHDSGTYLVKALLGEPSMQAALWWYQVFKTEGVTGQDRWPERDLRAKLLLI